MKCAIAAMLIATAFAVAVLARRHFDPGALVVAGDQFTDARQVSIPVERHSAGYDGQFYYRLALDPFTNQWNAHGIRFDYPTYRQQRIFMPLLAWAATAGHARTIPIAIVLINIVAVGLLAASSARIFSDCGLNPWLSAAAWMYPGWLLSMTRDCAEIVEVALLVAMIAAAQRRRTALAVVAAVAAALTKETALLAIAACAIAAPWLVIAIAAQLGFKFTLFYVWHAAPSFGLRHFSIPFAGLVQSFSLQRPFPVFTNVEIIALGLCVTAAALGRPWARPQGAVGHALTLAFALYVPLLAVLDASFWIEDWSFMRAASEFWVLGALVARNRAAVAISIATWCALAAHILFIRLG